jgi:hypothetical protein
VVDNLYVCTRGGIPPCPSCHAVDSSYDAKQMEVFTFNFFNIAHTVH